MLIRINNRPLLNYNPLAYFLQKKSGENLVHFNGANGDYTISDTSISIPTGAIDGEVTIQAVDDTIYEPGPDDTIIVEISSVTNAVENTTQQEIITIIDNDSEPSASLSIDNTTLSG